VKWKPLNGAVVDNPSLKSVEGYDRMKRSIVIRVQSVRASMTEEISVVVQSP
jgi:hypothetical protein